MEFVHLMADGSTCILKKDKPALKKGSIPSVFPENDPRKSTVEYLVVNNTEDNFRAIQSISYCIYWFIET